MKWWFLSVFIGVICFSCGNEKGSSRGKPDCFIEDSIMVDLLADMHVAQGIYKVGFGNKDSISHNSFHNAVYTKYETTKGVVDSNMAYRAQFPVSYERMYDLVMEEISQRQIANDGEAEEHVENEEHVMEDEDAEFFHEEDLEEMEGIYDGDHQGEFKEDRE